MKPGPLDRLIHVLSKLPGIGEKTATRLSFFLLRSKTGLSEELAQALLDVSREMRLCETCCNVASKSPCDFCLDTKRDRATLCVVAQPQDLKAVEKSGVFHGHYHILHGLLSPLDGIGPEDLRIAELVQRLHSGEIREVVLAVSANIEGDTTALYLGRVLQDYPVRVTRLGQGLPAGGELEYLDSFTVGRAFESRREL